MPVYEKWLERCREHFECGAEYVAAVKNRRMRLAAALPLLIGAKALPMMQAADWETLSAGVKVSRKVVKRVMLRAVLANLTRGGMARPTKPASASTTVPKHWRSVWWNSASSSQRGRLQTPSAWLATAADRDWAPGWKHY